MVIIKAAINLALVLCVFVIVLVLIVSMFGSAWGAEKGTQQYQRLSSPEKAIKVVGDPVFTYEPTCTNPSGNNLTNCKAFKYHLTAAADTLYNETIELVVSIQFKGFDGIVPIDISGRSEFFYYNKIEYNNVDLKGISTASDIPSNEPPYMNFSEIKTFSGCARNKQWIQVGDFSVGVILPHLSNYVEILCKPNFEVQCKGETKLISVGVGDKKDLSMCGGIITVEVPEKKKVNDQIEFNTFYSGCYDSSQIGSTLGGASCVNERINCLHIKATDVLEESEFKGNGERITFSFWKLRPDDDTRKHADDLYIQLNKNCFGGEFTQKDRFTNPYCSKLYLGSYEFFIPVVQSRDDMILKNCQ